MESTLIPNGKENPKFRTPTEKIILAEDGRPIRVVSVTPLHYVDTDGSLKDIDTALEETRDSYINKTNTFESHIAKDFAEGVTIKKGSMTFSWKPDVATLLGAESPFTRFFFHPDQTTFEPGGSYVLFESYEGGWSEEYSVGPGSLEHFIYIASPPELPRNSNLDDLELRG